MLLRQPCTLMEEEEDLRTSLRSLNVCLFIFTPEVTVGAFDLSSTSSILKKELLKIGKIQFAQYQLSDDVDKRWYSSIGRSIHLM